MNFLKGIFRKKESKIVLGRWARTNDVTKSIYANSDHCGDAICGDPKKVKTIVHKQKDIKVKLPPSNNFHSQASQNSVKKNENTENFCCMLLGLNGPCDDCPLLPGPAQITIMPEIGVKYM
ncbi:MAG: hypothetical protein CMG00_07680 [Candidatus Marinimicrobia bacterium]|nr:hypothetical protein [Candidatus Neomarinimicrobiota bacterium]|tara:strand:- start:883 stop:1245 length:363 start_codon:yes stop_codon:yes gene_type:complete